jgi:hypothetical protein
VPLLAMRRGEGGEAEKEIGSVQKAKLKVTYSEREGIEERRKQSIISQ